MRQHSIECQKTDTVVVTSFVILRMVYLNRLVAGFYLILILSVLIIPIRFQSVKCMPVNEGYHWFQKTMRRLFCRSGAGEGRLRKSIPTIGTKTNFRYSVL